MIGRQICCWYSAAYGLHAHLLDIGAEPLKEPGRDAGRLGVILDLNMTRLNRRYLDLQLLSQRGGGAKLGNAFRFSGLHTG